MVTHDYDPRKKGNTNGNPKNNSGILHGSLSRIQAKKENPIRAWQSHGAGGATIRIDGC